MKLRAAAKVAVLCCLVSARVFGQPTCVNFPAGFIPFSSISYVTAANSSGDHLVVGVPAAGAVSFITATVSLPAFTNQTFCDAQVQLGPQQYYPNAYVPTALEAEGNFSAFAGLLVDPLSGQPYQGGIIPISQLNKVFAWRIGPAQAASAARGWSPTGSMRVGRVEQAAAMLPSGKVLVVGPDDTSDIFDPGTGSFASAGQMLFSHGSTLTATQLNDGRILIIGGNNFPSAAELFDPSSGQYTSAGSTVQPHGLYHTATLLNDGRVLVVGGLAISGNGGKSTDVDSGAEIYDPKSGLFAPTGPIAVNRNLHTATLLADGRVLIAGGSPKGTGPTNTEFDSTEIYNPTLGSFSPGGTMEEPRAAHFAVLLASGKVLIGGGSSLDGSAELFDPVTNRFTPTGSMSVATRSVACATLLSSGQVMVAGGQDAGTNIATNSVELYNPESGAFATAGSMDDSRAAFTATLLLGGEVLVTGGFAFPSAIWSSAELYTPLTEGLVTSQTGLTFRVAAGNTSVLSQSVAVLSATDTIPWTLSTHTYQGGNWLSVTPTSGTSGPTTAPVVLSITVNPAGLAAQDYYGAVTLTPTDGKHPPISIAIVLSIVPAGATAPPGVTPNGLVFLPAAGATPAPQSFTISNLTSKPLTFSGVGSTTPGWFSFSPKSGTINAGQTTSVTVTPSIAALTNGVYNGSINLSFGDGSTQTVALLLVITGSPPASTGGIVAAAATPTCTATKLLPVFTTIGIGFNTPAAWPVPIIVQVVDDCEVAFNAGSVIVSFNDGDAPISLLSIGNGNWAGTWVPAHNATGFTVRADAQQLPLTGSVQVSGQVSSNPSVPIVGAGAVVSSGDFSSSPALGLLVSIFGSGLADGSAGNSGLPLPQQIGSTSVVLSGRVLPLLYVSPSQVNVIIPYDVPVNTAQQLVVLRGNAISVPVPLAVYDSEPAILSTAGNGTGQGDIYKVDAQGNAVLADGNAPATAGDALVIYAVGLGSVTPTITAGDGAPGTALSYAVAPVSATIGGVSAPVLFAGLTPGFVGLYQVNLMVPTGIAASGNVPVTVSVAGKSSAGSVFMAVR